MKRKGVVMATVLGLFGWLMISLMYGGIVNKVFAGDKQLTFAWEKSVLEPDLDKFVIESSVTGGAGASDWVEIFEIQYSAGVTEYTSAQVFASPDGASVKYWFRIKAMDTSANPSAWTYGDSDGNECTITIDFEPPGTVIEFTVTVVGG